MKKGKSISRSGICVIIPSYNGGEFLLPCLDSLANQVLPANKVIVVDNGSSDDSKSIVENHPLRPELIPLSENQGFARAVNTGIRACGDDAVALLNNDTEADPRWLLFGAKGMEKYPEADFFASLVLKKHDRDRVDSAGACYARDGRPFPIAMNERSSACRAEKPVLAASAGAAFFRKGFFDQVGLFDERFFAYLEDVEICLRAQLLGKKGMFLPEAVVYHHGGGTSLGDRPSLAPVDSEMRVRWIARNKILIMARDVPFSLIIRWCPWMAMGMARSAAYHIFRSGQAGAFFAGTFQGLLAVPGMLALRSELQKKRMITPRQLAAKIRGVERKS
jgi:GT2 family glycosyltransferase